MTEIRTVSYGGGVQSTALLVLAAQRRIDFPVFLMANVGDDSEHPATLAYVREIAAPYAAEHGIDLRILDRVKRDGSTETLWGRLMRPESRSLPIPVRMSNGAPGTRSCTADFKIRVIGKWLREHGAKAGKSCREHQATDQCDGTCTPEAPGHRCLEVHDCGPRPYCPKCTMPNLATVAIGISVDEIHRANSRRVELHERIVYPLLDLRMRRDDCQRVIAEAGLPVPPKSSCFFCPFHRPAAWQDLARDEPELFAKSAELEDTLNKRRAVRGKDPVYLTRFGMPLREAIATDQDLLPLDHGDCDSGWCMT